LFQVSAHFRHAVFEFMQLVLDLLQVTKRGQRRFVNSRAGLKVNVLSKHTEPNAARTNDVTAISRFFVADKAKDRSLAGAVATDKPNMFARIHL
jgi:hypothetical protein